MQINPGIKISFFLSLRPNLKETACFVLLTYQAYFIKISFEFFDSMWKALNICIFYSLINSV